jgi:cell division protein FtsQ
MLVDKINHCSFWQRIKPKIVGLLKLSILGALTFLLFQGWRLLKDPQNFPIEKVIISSSYEHLNQAFLKEMITPFLKGGFLSFTADNLQETLKNVPWVYDVYIQRQWPDLVAIKIIEQTAEEIWNNDYLLNPEGMIFKVPKETFPEELPKLFGTNEKVPEVLETFRQAQTIIKPLDFAITDFGIDQNNEWRMILNHSLLVLLGPSDPLGKLQELVIFYPKIASSHPEQKISKLDLRYQSGIAAMWQK